MGLCSVDIVRSGDVYGGGVAVLMGHGRCYWAGNSFHLIIVPSVQRVNTGCYTVLFVCHSAQCVTGCCSIACWLLWPTLGPVKFTSAQ